jgi:hypothetical protein
MSTANLLSCFRWLAAVACVLSSATVHAQAGAAAASPQGSESDDERIRALVRRGEKLYESGQTLQARQPLLEAWTLRQSYDVATMLGQVEQDLGHDADAATYYEFALRNFAPTESEDALKGLRARLSDVSTKVTALDVRVNRDNAEVSVDSRVVGKSPLPARVFLSPGAHLIAATWQGQQQQASIVGKPGEERAVSLSFGDATSATSATSAANSPSTPASTSSGTGPAAAPLIASRSPSPVPLVVGGILGLAGVGIGTGFALAAGSEKRRADSLRTHLPDGACKGSDRPMQTCTDLRDAVDAHDRDRNISTAGFVVGGAAILGTLGYWLFSQPSSDERAQTGHGRTQAEHGRTLSLRAAATTKEGAFWLSGTW